MITVFAGGIGAARFLRGLVRAVDPSEITVVVNVGDDLDLHGLRVCPDLDTITYTLGGGIHPEQQWGRADERFTVAEELARYDATTWFTLGDRDIALHLHRSQRLRNGEPLHRVTADIAERWGLEIRLLPATDSPVETRILTADGRDLHFQEYWVGERGAPAVDEVVLDGADHAFPAPGVLEAIAGADALLLCPSNPVVSIGTIMAVPGIADAVQNSAAPLVGVSPIVGDAVVRGMADRLLPAIGVDVSAAGVGAHYATALGLDGWIIDEADRDADVSGLLEAGVRVQVRDTMMDDVEVATALAADAVALAASIRAGDPSA